MTLEEVKQKLCLDCMECCKTMIIPTLYSVVNDKMSLDLFEMRGIKVNYGNFGPTLVLPSPCQYIGEEGCHIYNDRPDVCRNYDGRRVDEMQDICQWHRIIKATCHICKHIFYSGEELKDTVCSKCGSSETLSIRAA